MVQLVAGGWITIRTSENVPEMSDKVIKWLNYITGLSPDRFSPLQNLAREEWDDERNFWSLRWIEMWLHFNVEWTLQKKTVALFLHTREGHWFGHGTGDHSRRRSGDGWCGSGWCSGWEKEWKKKHQVPITSLSLHWAIYWYKPVYISAGQASSLHLNMQNVNVLLHLFASLCNILYFDVAKFSIKQFSLVYLTVSVVRQRN